MSESDSQIYVVDDDVSVREAVGNLIRSAGLSVKTFSSAQETLASLRKELPSGSMNFAPIRGLYLWKGMSQLVKCAKLDFIGMRSVILRIQDTK